MSDIRDLTTAYVAAFDACDLDKVADLFADGFTLTDAEVTALSPKAEVLAYIKGIFDANTELSFIAHRILVEGNTSVIHFTLTLSEMVLDGVDLIVWEGAQMVRMHAYLTPHS